MTQDIGPVDNKYHPNEPLWVSQLRTLVASQFHLRLDEGTYNPVRSRPVGRQHGISDREQRDYPYWEIGVPYIHESSGREALPRVFEYIGTLAQIESNCEAWSDEIPYTSPPQRRGAAGARFMLWFEVSNNPSNSEPPAEPTYLEPGVVLPNTDKHYTVRIRDTTKEDAYVDGYFTDDFREAQYTMYNVANQLQAHMEVWLLDSKTLKDYGFVSGTWRV